MTALAESGLLIAAVNRGDRRRRALSLRVAPKYAVISFAGMDQRIQFCERDGARIAYAIVGTGPALVCDTGWISHLEFMWEAGAFRSFFESLAQSRTIIRYDKPGTGLSDRHRLDFSIDVEVRALEAVIAAVGLPRFDLLGTSQGGLVATLMARRYPDRVGRLVLYGTWAHGAELAPDAVKATVPKLIRAHWGLGSRTLADVFLANAGAEAAEWFASAQRLSASPEMAANLLEEFYRSDIRAALRSLTVPALVLHRQNDRAVPFEQGREVAALIPRAVLTPLQGTAHLPYFGDVEPLIEAIHKFLAAAPESPLTSRERQVVALVARGHTNRDIADALTISERTAENHVQRVLNRLRLRSRAQLAAWAVQHDLAVSDVSDEL